jgi:hypothetical protein
MTDTQLSSVLDKLGAVLGEGLGLKNSLRELVSSIPSHHIRG